MKVLFVSNDLTHHLVPFFESIMSIYGKGNCIFAVLEPCDNRHRMGFPAYNEPWVFVKYERTRDEYVKLYKEADIIITRVWNHLDLIEDSLQNRKMVFYASERWFKPPIGKVRLLVPSYFIRYLKFRKLSKYENFYYLAMGYYASLDFKFLKLFKNRIFHFGYFTPTFTEANFRNESNKPTVEILWAGRMLTWKRVKDLLIVFNDLVNSYNIKLIIVGDGPKCNELVQYADTNKIQNITFRKFVPNKELKQIMRDADIYVLPSSGYEGWGAVINEAMQTKCAVIASKETGAARSMIIDGKNGLTFPSGDRNELRKTIVKLLEDQILLNRLKLEGYKTISETWSATEAARRFCIIIENIKKESSLDIFKDGPMQLMG